MSITARKETMRGVPDRLSTKSHDVKARDMVISLMGLGVISLILILNG